MNVAPSNVPGAGPVKLPSNGNFGSGDLLVTRKKPVLDIYKYSDFEEMADLDNEEDDLNEESVMDRLKATDNSRSPERQHSDYVKAERNKFNEWKKERRLYFVEKLKAADAPEEKKLLKNQFKLEIIKKKRKLSEKLKKKRVDKSTKGLKT